MAFDSIIVASNTLTPARKLSRECRRRVDKGIELYEDKQAPVIIMNGGPGKFTEPTPEGTFVPRGTHPVQCEVMRAYAMALGVPEDDIVMQDYSSDTVGEAYFCKEMILVPEKWKTNVYVTSNYHVPRCMAVYDHILGKGFSTVFTGVAVDSDNDPEIWAFERRAYAMFKEQFGDTPKGDSAAIEEVLYSKHGIYSKIPEEKQLRFHTRA